MDRDFEVFFELRLREIEDRYYLRGPFGFRPYRYLDLLDVRFARRVRWRSDAKYFLLYNVIFVLLEPVDYVRPQVFNSPEFFDEVRADLELVSSKAEEIALDRDKGYVSSTSVAIALGQVVDRLRTSRFKVWGRSEDLGDRE